MAHVYVVVLILVLCAAGLGGGLLAARMMGLTKPRSDD